MKTFLSFLSPPIILSSAGGEAGGEPTGPVLRTRHHLPGQCCVPGIKRQVRPRSSSGGQGTRGRCRNTFHQTASQRRERCRGQLVAIEIKSHAMRRRTSGTTEMMGKSFFWSKRRKQFRGTHRLVTEGIASYRRM